MHALAVVDGGLGRRELGGRDRPLDRADLGIVEGDAGGVDRGASHLDARDHVGQQVLDAPGTRRWAGRTARAPWRRRRPGRWSPRRCRAGEPATSAAPCSRSARGAVGVEHLLAGGQVAGRAGAPASAGRAGTVDRFDVDRSTRSTDPDAVVVEDEQRVERVEVLDETATGRRARCRRRSTSPVGRAVDQRRRRGASTPAGRAPAPDPAPRTRAPRRPTRARRRRRPRAGAGRTRPSRPARATRRGRRRPSAERAHRLDVEATLAEGAHALLQRDLVVGQLEVHGASAPSGGRGCARRRCCAGSGWCRPRW